jgi:potassium/hydrogen antiporter
LFDSVSIALIASAFIILIGFSGNYFFKKTGFPSMLFLIFIGIIFGPVLGVFNPASVMSFAPYIAALALTFILFDGGMGLNIKRVLSNGPRAVVLAVLGFVFSVFGVCAFAVLVLNVPLTYGLLLGSIFGGSSSVAVVGLANKIKMNKQSSIILILESAITDILCVVISLSLLAILVTGQADIPAIGLGIAGKFLIGALVGFGIGFAWLFALRKLASYPFSYMLTLGIVLLSYALSEGLGGSGAFSALLFGLILGNEKELFKFLRQDRPKAEKIEFVVSRGLKRFEAEVAFLISTFFFVFLGIIFSISSLGLLLSGVALSMILVGARFLAVWISTQNTSLKKDRTIMTLILTRGLAAAVLATLPAQYNLPFADLFVSAAVVIIITTAIIATVGSLAIARPSLRNRNHTEQDQTNNNRYPLDKETSVLQN